MTAEERILNGIPGAAIFQTSIDGYNLRYIRAGSGPPAFLFHGLNMGWGQWLKNIPELAKHCTVYAVNLPGSGESIPLEIESDNLSEKLIEVAIQLVEGLAREPIVAIGHSSGGWICLRLALRRPDLVRKVVVANPIGFHTSTPLRYKILGMGFMARFLARTVMIPTLNNMRNFLAGVFGDKQAIPEEFLDYYVESFSRPNNIHPFLLINRLSGLSSFHGDFIVRGEIDSLAVPTLVVFGDADPLLPLKDDIRSILRSVPSITLRSMTGVGHVPPLESSAEFNQFVVEFIR